MSSKSIYSFHTTNRNLSEVFSVEYSDMEAPAEAYDWRLLEQVFTDSVAGLQRGYTEEMRVAINEKISKALTGKKHTDEHRQNNSIAQTGKQQSEEAKLKKSKALAGKPKSPEHKAKMKLAWEKRRLTPTSDETRKKISEARKKHQLLTKGICSE